MPGMKRKILLVIQEQQAAKKRRSSKYDKFKSMDAWNLRRRRERDRRRRSRAKTSAAQPVVIAKGSRHVPCYTCGKRRACCKCFTSGLGKDIASLFNRKLFRSMQQRIGQADIQTWKDTGDMSFYHKQIASKGHISYTVLWPLTFCWRMFSNGHLWKALLQAKAVSLRQPPVWSRWRTVLQTFQNEGASWYAGVYYSGNKLTHYRMSTTHSWRCCTAPQMDDIARVLQAMKIVWHVASSMRENLLAFQKKPTREGWQKCTENFLHQIRCRTKGMFNDYALKKSLDGILIADPRLEKYISCWPMRCPAYVSMLPSLYPGIRKSNKALLLAACHYHSQLKSFFPRFRLCDSLAHLCWFHRSDSV